MHQYTIMLHELHWGVSELPISSVELVATCNSILLEYPFKVLGLASYNYSYTPV
jgi:hypothetical protein